MAPHCGEMACEEEIKKKSGEVDNNDTEMLNEQGEKIEKLSGAAKSLCIPFEQPVGIENHKCVMCGTAGKEFIMFGRSY